VFPIILQNIFLFKTLKRIKQKNLWALWIRFMSKSISVNLNSQTIIQMHKAK